MSILASLTPPEGLRVLVTAGAGGIGHAIARGFAETGARVHISDVDASAVEAVTDERITGSVANAADDAETEALFAEAVDSMGGLDVVIANAGVAGPTAGVGEISTAEWDQCLEINLRGAYLAARFGAPELVRSKGSFIALSSVAGRLPYAYRTPYAASKWGVVGLAKSLAAELGPEGVRSNAILPGIVKGPRIDKVISARAEQLGISFEEMREQYLAKVSLRRMVTPEDIAAMCLFLASPGGGNVSGQALSVCGNVETL
ncbi:SDR family oxidoreductase [Salipiger mucosus]|uniref:Oxidoreductase, short chain dehydrogenase/reductase family n=1 Tax=Salipiger mucosus DSM 16094 TaxID=1123237 RepID=S9R176_9RHOB|nr:SDR family oxidoreductase [Salipiger mucosus]EPX85693.1 Oxidoreductase, short chain dehydrogenase/reductase family [Salipiger mucosus DSM 16094]